MQEFGIEELWIISSSLQKFHLEYFLSSSNFQSMKITLHTSVDESSGVDEEALETDPGSTLDPRVLTIILNRFIAIRFYCE